MLAIVSPSCPGSDPLTLQALKRMKDRDRLSRYVNFIPPHKQKHYRGKIAALLANTVSVLS